MSYRIQWNIPPETLVEHWIWAFRASSQKSSSFSWLTATGWNVPTSLCHANQCTNKTSNIESYKKYI
jgi:hypothetical protein